MKTLFPDGQTKWKYYSVILVRNKVGGGANNKKSGSDIGRPQGPTMTQRGISLTLETKVALSLLESRRVPAYNKTTPVMESTSSGSRLVLDKGTFPKISEPIL